MSQGLFSLKIGRPLGGGTYVLYFEENVPDNEFRQKIESC